MLILTQKLLLLDRGLENFCLITNTYWSLLIIISRELLTNGCINKQLSRKLVATGIQILMLKMNLQNYFLMTFY
jgi:hypothetical protein